MHPHQMEELLFLRYFYSEARHAMGPASDEIYQLIKEGYSNTLPEGYEIDNDE